MNKNSKKLSFALLDRQNGVPEPEPAVGEEFPLPAWYRSIRELPLDELSIFDISRAIQQKIHLEHVVPIALRFSELDPLAGERYDGELLVAFTGIPHDYWLSHEAERLLLRKAIHYVLQAERTNSYVRQEVEELSHKITVSS